MGRVNFGVTEAPSHTKLNTVADQSVIPASTTTRNGWGSVPAGMVSYDTTLQAYFYYDGSNWILSGGGRRIGVHLSRTFGQTMNHNTSTDLIWATGEQDDDNMWGSGSTVTVPAAFAGIYMATIQVYYLAGASIGTLGGLISISTTNDYIEKTWEANYDKDSMTHTALHMAAGHTFKASVTDSNTVDKQITCRLNFWRLMA